MTSAKFLNYVASSPLAPMTLYKLSVLLSAFRAPLPHPSNNDVIYACPLNQIQLWRRGLDSVVAEILNCEGLSGRKWDGGLKVPERIPKVGGRKMASFGKQERGRSCETWWTKLEVEHLGSLSWHIT